MPGGPGGPGRPGGGPRGGFGGGPGGPGRGPGGGFGGPHHQRPGGPPPPPPPYGHRGYGYHRPHGCCLMPFCILGGMIALVAMLIGFCF